MLRFLFVFGLVDFSPSVHSSRRLTVSDVFDEQMILWEYHTVGKDYCKAKCPPVIVFCKMWALYRLCNYVCQPYNHKITFGKKVLQSLYYSKVAPVPPFQLAVF